LELVYFRLVGDGRCFAVPASLFGWTGFLSMQYEESIANALLRCVCYIWLRDVSISLPIHAIGEMRLCRPPAPIQPKYTGGIVKVCDHIPKNLRLDWVSQKLGIRDPSVLALLKGHLAKNKLERELCDKLFEAREEKNLSHKQLAKNTGVKESIVKKMEHSARLTNSNLFIVLASLGYTLEIVPLPKD